MLFHEFFTLTWVVNKAQGKPQFPFEISCLDRSCIFTGNSITPNLCWKVFTNQIHPPWFLTSISIVDNSLGATVVTRFFTFSKNRCFQNFLFCDILFWNRRFQKQLIVTPWIHKIRIGSWLQCYNSISLSTLISQIFENRVFKIFCLVISCIWKGGL